MAAVVDSGMGGTPAPSSDAGSVVDSRCMMMRKEQRNQSMNEWINLRMSILCVLNSNKNSNGRYYRFSKRQDNPMNFVVQQESEQKIN